MNHTPTCHLNPNGHNLVVVTVFHGIASHFYKRVASWIMAIMIMNIGIVLLIHGNMFDTNLSYTFMGRIAEEHTWAYGCLGVGLLRLTGLVVNGGFKNFRWSAHMRSIGSGLSCLIWLQIAIGFMVAPQTGLGMAIYPFLLILDAYNSYVAAQEAGADAKVLIDEKECGKALERLKITPRNGDLRKDG